ncbi:MAG: signal peptidase I [Pseudomonadota bacterium]
MTAALAIFVASRMFWSPIWIPSGSMKPTLLVGDYILAQTFSGAPKRGDLIVYRHPVNEHDFVARIVAIGGDSILLKDGMVILNDEALAQAVQPDFVEPFELGGTAGMIPRCANAPVAQGGDCIKSMHTESFPSGRSYAVLDVGPSRFDNTPAFDVPPGHVFVLGDNRDNSIDSRMGEVAGGVGFVPVQNIRSVLRLVLFNFDLRPGRLLTVMK